MITKERLYKQIESLPDKLEVEELIEKLLLIDKIDSRIIESDNPDMVKLLWLQSVKDDLKIIYDFIALDSIKYASHQIQQIRDRASTLKRNP